MTKTEAKRFLREFQNEKNRSDEEDFAQTFSENFNLKLSFINENSAYTDGKLIVVDPSFFELFYDTETLEKAENYLEFSDELSKDPRVALKFLTRAQTIHESLHILYSEFPLLSLKDEDIYGNNEKKVLSLLNNIIEDTYIESVGISNYDNIEVYLKYFRCANYFKNPFTNFKYNKITVENFLEYLLRILLCPVDEKIKISGEFEDIYLKSEPFIIDALNSENSRKRYEKIKEIFELIRPFIPKEDKKLETEELEKILQDRNSFDPKKVGFKENKSIPRGDKVKKLLFRSKDLKSRKSNENKRFKTEVKKLKKEEKLQPGVRELKPNENFSSTPLHDSIKVYEHSIDLSEFNKEAYYSVVRKYKKIITKFRKEIEEKLFINELRYGGRYLFGNIIDSKRLIDRNKLYWKRSEVERKFPDLSILVIVDNSASMIIENRYRKCSEALIILNEALEDFDIDLGVISYNAPYNKGEINIEMLKEFNGPVRQKYNLLGFYPDGNSREGLILNWARKFLEKKSFSANKLLIILSDGLSIHEYDRYFPPLSTIDTKYAAQDLAATVKVIPVALDSENSTITYNALSEIYPTVVLNQDLNDLPNDLMKVILGELEFLM